MRRASIAENIRYWDEDADNWREHNHQVLVPDSTYGTNRLKAIQAALAEEQPLTGEWGLDLGGGHGVQLYLGNKIQTKRVLLADISHKMLMLSQNPDKVRLDASQKLPLAPHFFDWATAFFLTRYLTAEEQVELLDSITRVLVPGGIALILDHVVLEQPMERGLFEPEALARRYTGPATIKVKKLLEGTFDLNVGFDDDARYLGPVYLMSLHKD